MKNWCLNYDKYSVENESAEETLLTLCNGYMGIRASLELGSLNSIPGTFIAGVYDKPDMYDKVDRFGLMMVNKALCPSYAILPIFNQIRIEVGGYPIDFANCKIIDYSRELNMKEAVLTASYTLETPDKKVTKINTTSFVSKKELHIFASKIEVVAINYTDTLTVKFLYMQKTSPLFINRIMDYTCVTELVRAESIKDSIVMESKVTETGIAVALSGKTEGAGDKRYEKIADGIMEVYRLFAEEGKTYTYTRVCSIYTDCDSSNPFNDSMKSLSNCIAKGFETLSSENVQLWNAKWDIADIEISGEDEAQTILRWNIYSLIGLGIEDKTDTSISATGLHGTGYFGHVFWDTEIFLLPFYIATNPDIAKTLLMYRYNRINPARTLAMEVGCKGARFPWTSTWKGYNVTPIDWERVANREIHISGDVAYGFYNYFVKTGDVDFFNNYGVEVIVETAKYYATKAVKKEGKYHILDVIGPDEYNIHADDNYFTNYLAFWNIDRALIEMERLKDEDSKVYADISKKTMWNDELVSFLRGVASNMFYPKTVNNVNEQYTGFFNLQPIPKIERDNYNMPTTKIHSYDSTYQILKQADVVMMHFMFPNEFSEKIKSASYEFYSKCCVHGSSLSPSIHCIVGARLGLVDTAYGYFQLSTFMDVKNMHMDKSTKDGIHTACIGGSWATMIFGYGGVNTDSDKLSFKPVLPSEIKGLKFSYIYKSILYRIDINKEAFKVTNASEKNAEFYVNGVKNILLPQKSKIFAI